MPWAYKINGISEIVEVAFTGKTTAHDLREATSKLIAQVKEKDKKLFLVDTTEMEFAAWSTDLYDLPTKQYREEGMDSHYRIAVLLSERRSEKEAAEFYETICRSCGWQVRTFSEHRQAVDWLTSDFSHQ